MIGDEHLLAPVPRQAFGDNARDDVGRAARAGGDDQLHRRGGEVLCGCGEDTGEARQHQSGDDEFPHPEERGEAARLEGWAFRRCASTLTRVQSPRINASFFERDHPLTCRSAATASTIESKCCEKIKLTGRRLAVYPPNIPALCSATRVSNPLRAVPT